MKYPDSKEKAKPKKSFKYKNNRNYIIACFIIKIIFIIIFILCLIHKIIFYNYKEKKIKNIKIKDETK